MTLVVVCACIAVLTGLRMIVSAFVAPRAIGFAAIVIVTRS